MSELATVIQSSRLFCALAEADKQWLVEQAKRSVGRKGQVFPWSGDCFFVISKGRFKLVRTCPSDGRELTLMLLTPGDGFEAIGILDDEPHEVSAVALDNFELLEVPPAKLLEWSRHSPGFNKALLQYLGHQLEQLSDLAADLTFLDTHVRLAKLILNHLDQAEHAVMGTIRDLSDENIASLIGTVRKVVNRHITHLRDEGIIESRRGHLHVVDLEALAARAAAVLRRD